MSIEKGPRPSGVFPLIDAAEIEWNAARGFSFNLTIEGDRTLLAPTGLVAGETYTLAITQGAGGSHVLTYEPGGYKFWESPLDDAALSTAAGATDILQFYSEDGVTLTLLSIIKWTKPLLAAPTNFAAEDQVGQVVLTWDDNETIESGFIIERFGDDDVWHVVTSTAANVETYTDVFAPGPRDYRISVNAAAFIAYAYVTGNSLLAAPVIAAEEATGVGGVNLTWAANAAAEDIRIQRKNALFPAYADLITLPFSDLSYHDNAGANVEGPYTYRAYAEIAPDIESAASNEVTSEFAVTPD